MADFFAPKSGTSNSITRLHTSRAVQLIKSPSKWRLWVYNSARYSKNSMTNCLGPRAAETTLRSDKYGLPIRPKSGRKQPYKDGYLLKKAVWSNPTPKRVAKNNSTNRISTCSRLLLFEERQNQSHKVEGLLRNYTNAVKERQVKACS